MRKKNSNKVSINLNSTQAIFLQLFHEVNSGHTVTDHQKNQLTSMLEASIGALSLDRALSRFLREKHNPELSDKFKESINDIKYFSFNTRHFDKLDQILKKCARNLKMIEAGHQVEEFEKLSLAEFGVLTDFSKLTAKLDDYSSKGLIPKSGKLHQLFVQSTKAQEILEQQTMPDQLVSQTNLGHVTKRQFELNKALYNKIFKLTAQDEATFIEKAKETFEIYLKSEHILGDKTPPSKAMDKLLDEQFKLLHKEYDKQHPSTFAGHFIKLLDSFANWIGIKDNKAKGIIKNVTEAIKKDSAINRELDTLIKDTNSSLDQIKQYDLLDNLMDGNKLRALDTKELDMLYRLTVLDPYFNYTDYNNIPEDKKYHLQNLCNKLDNGKPLDRKEMISDIEHILSRRTPAITTADINISKSYKSDAQIDKIKGRIQNLQFEIPENMKKDKELAFKVLDGILREIKDKAAAYLLKVKKYDYAIKSVELSAHIKIIIDGEKSLDKVKTSIIEQFEKAALESFTPQQKSLINTGLDKILASSCSSSKKATHIMSFAKTALTTPALLAQKVRAIDSALTLHDGMSKKLQQEPIITQITSKILEETTRQINLFDKDNPLLEAHKLIGGEEDYKSNIKERLFANPYLISQLTDKTIQEKFAQKLFKNLTSFAIASGLPETLAVKNPDMAGAQLKACIDESISATSKKLGLKASSSERNDLPKVKRPGQDQTR